MIATAEGAALEKAEHLANLLVNGHHSYEQAWQQASAIALVSIAESLEAIATRLSDGFPHPTDN